MKSTLVQSLAVFSLALNVCLLGWHHFGPTAPAEDSSPDLPSPVTPQPPPNASASSAILPLLTPVRWVELTNADWALYARNLRAIGCPEPIVESVIAMEIDEAFRARWENRPRETNYWQTGGEEYKERCARRVLKGEFEKQRCLAIFEALGKQWCELSFRSWKNDIAQLIPWPRDPPPGPAQAVLRKYFDLAENLGDYSPDARLLTPREQADRWQWQREMFADFSAVLSPAQFEEIEFRFMTFSILDVWSIPSQFGNEFTPAEFREVLRIKKMGTKYLGKLFFEEDPPLSNEIKMEQETRLRTFLGETRYRGYQRAQDFEFQGLHRTLDNLDQPIETIWHVYDIEKAAATEVNRLRDDSQIAPPEKARLLNALRQETETTMKQALGSVAAEKYMGRNWTDRFAVASP